MDIARTPSTPDGNPHLADVPPEPKAPPIIRREDYRPFPWAVPETRLEFELGLQETRVRSTLRVERSHTAEPSPTIRLNGDGLTPLSVEVDGEEVGSWTMDGGDLLLSLPGEQHEIAITTRIDPAANTQLMGLYASGGMLCTQCEAEGFRRITFFPDRPDVMSVYTVRMIADRATFPVLLSNGNEIETGDAGDGRHFAVWHDPWPKPSYLFALVAGNLVANRDHFTTMSGREVDLAIWVRASVAGSGDLPRTGHAMDSLKRAMRWDEEVFGREYDLEVFNIVAVGDFNMGAMENKGLNIFNTKYVLADEDTATDGDFDAVEGVIAHEYFHNWSGNRVTCRDWFQLSLKEGFTVLRDQLFSQDMRSAPVKRIEDVRVLRAVQFPEDSGPLAHPIRPDSYREISNFYTATVYNKGAEIIRMMRELAGEERFRRGCDFYFERHDGEAATCEDFIRAMEVGAGLDLSQFRRWYEQAGTPRVAVALDHQGDTVTLTLSQAIPPTPGQPEKAPVPVPLKLALLDRRSGRHGGEQIIVLDEERQEFRFDGFAEPPVLSINRGFSAPVIVERAADADELSFLATHDDDPFARYEALQELVADHVVAATKDKLDDPARTQGRAAIATAIAAVLRDDALDQSMRGELLMLPTHAYLLERIERADPVRLAEEREGLKAWLGGELAQPLIQLYERVAAAPGGSDAEARGARKVKTVALTFLAAADAAQGASLARRQYESATNITDRQGALMVLAGLETPEREAALADFHNRYAGNELVIDKWFALQAMSVHPRVREQVTELAEHPAFTLANPNRVRALWMAFAGNPLAFHSAGGEGYRMLADLILELDPVNSQTAARFVPPLGRWRRIEPGRAQLMRAALERIADAPRLSRDTYEQVTRSLD
jgi:aminopeptidase N